MLEVKRTKTKMDDRWNTIIVEDGRDAEVIGANSRVSVLNAVFQWLARRDKENCYNTQCKKIEENKKGKTRDLYQKMQEKKGNSNLD